MATLSWTIFRKDGDLHVDALARSKHSKVPAVKFAVGILFLLSGEAVDMDLCRGRSIVRSKCFACDAPVLSKFS